MRRHRPVELKDPHVATLLPPEGAVSGFGRPGATDAGRHRQRLRGSRGFTLIEVVIAIVLTSIVATMAAVFLRQPMNAYVDLGRRAALTGAADAALRRIARELNAALPNSVRVDATGTYLEFLPTSAGGRYRVAPQADGTGDSFDVSSSSDNSFDVLGPTVTVASGDQLVIDNLGIPGADAYAGDTRRTLAATGTALSNLQYTLGSGGQFPFPSPSNRFQIVQTPVSFVCTAGTLRRYAGYATQATQPTDVTAAPLVGLSGANNALLTDSVTACTFGYATGVLARNGVATLRLTLTSGGESVTLLQQAHVDNAP